MSNRLQPSHFHNLEDALKAAWSLLGKGARNARSSFHVMQIASVTADGLPAIRSVVLRGVDAANRTIRFHTDSRSPKANEIFERPQIAAHFYSPKEKVQLRLQCRAQLHHHDAWSSSAWRHLQEMSRECYRQARPPGALLETPAHASFEPACDQQEAYDNFAVVTARIQRLEWLYLSSQGHRRARFEWPRGRQVATWLAP